MGKIIRKGYARSRYIGNETMSEYLSRKLIIARIGREFRKEILFRDFGYRKDKIKTFCHGRNITLPVKKIVLPRERKMYY